MGVIAYSLIIGENIFYRTVTSASYQITPLALAGSTGKISNISVKEVGQDWIPNPNTTLVFDGSSMDIQSLSGTGEYGAAATEVNFKSGKQYLITINVVSCNVPSQIRVGGTNSTGSLSLNIWGSGDIGIGTSSIVWTAFADLTYISIGGRNDVTTLKIDFLSVAEVLPYLPPRQSIQLLYGLQSTDDSNQSSFLNGITDSLFAIPDNSVMYFHADVIAVRVGGVHATGAVGDYGSWVERGVIINKSGVLSINRERDTIKSSGSVTNWQPTGIVDGTNFAMRVRGHADMTIEWASNITFTEIKTGVAL